MTEDARPVDADLRRAARVLVTTSRALVGISLRSLAASPVEVTLAQHRLLVLLASRGPQTIGALRAQLGVDQSNASRLVDRLQRLGLVERRSAPADGRSVEVVLGPSGRSVLDAVTAAREREISTLLDDLTATERRAVTRGLVAFNRVAGEIDDAHWPG